MRQRRLCVSVLAWSAYQPVQIGFGQTDSTLALIRDFRLGCTAHARAYKSDADALFHLAFLYNTEDYVGIRLCRLPDNLSYFVDLSQSEIFATGDVKQDASRAFEGRTEERICQSSTCRFESGPFAFTLAVRHKRGAATSHHRANIREVHVYHAGHRNDVGNALHPLPQHLVGCLKCPFEGHFPVKGRKEPVIFDDNKGVDLLAKAADSLLGDLASFRAFE